MYWLRTFDILNLALFLLLCLGWSLGGWLLAAHAFRLRSSERLLAGFATGLLLFITLSNLLANLPERLLPLPLAYWAAGGLVLLLGIAAAWRDRRSASPAAASSDHPEPANLQSSNLEPASKISRAPTPPLPLSDLRSWPQLLTLALLTLLFALIGRGLGLFDDYLHLPLVSVMAAGDIPPHFYLNPDLHFAYHYGLQVLAAGLVRLAGFFPWSAWDLSKALAIALTLCLSWLWVRRVTPSDRAASLGAFLITFAGGARWLLLLLPLPFLLWLSPAIALTPTALDAGDTLLQILASPWPADGSGPYPFPFAFHNGIFVPAMFALGASGALPFAAVLLLLLLARRDGFSLLGAAAAALIFANLALTAEHLFVFLWGGIALAGLVYVLWGRDGASLSARLREPQVASWAAVLLISGLLSVVQGAFITEAVRNILLRLQGVESGTGGSYDYFSFIPRWPPAVYSAHFGELSFLNPRQLPVLLAEMGPALLLGLPVSWSILRRIRQRDWMWAGLALAALLSFLIAVFFRYGVERSSTRLPATALWIWVALGFPILWNGWHRMRPLSHLVWQTAYAAAVFGGVVILAVELMALPAPQLSYFINNHDAAITRQHWSRLPLGTQVLDASPHRAVTIFGRPAQTSLDFYHNLPEWDALVAQPDPKAVARAGFAFIYMDDDWWRDLTAVQKEALRQPCVERYAEADPTGRDFRWLLDVRGCK